MNEIWKSIGKFVFFVFVAAMLGWAAHQTVTGVSAAIPGDKLTPYLALALFDGGAFAWLLCFTSFARGTGQRSAALLLTVVDVAGVIFMTAGGLGLVSSEAVKLGLVLATAANYGAWYFYKSASPEVRQAIQSQNLEDKKFDEALKREQELTEIAMQQAKMSMQSEGAKLGSIIAKRMTASIKYSMNLPLTASEKKIWVEGEVIDAEFTETQLAGLPAPVTPSPFWSALQSFFGNARRVYSELSNTPESSNSTSSKDGDQDRNA